LAASAAHTDGGGDCGDDSFSYQVLHFPPVRVQLFFLFVCYIETDSAIYNKFWLGIGFVSNTVGRSVGLSVGRTFVRSFVFLFIYGMDCSATVTRCDVSRRWKEMGDTTVIGALLFY
jgi:uncharacterized membrane protein (DUF485 family)